MKPDSQSTDPGTRNNVLEPHRERSAGRLENMTPDRRLEFERAGELFACPAAGMTSTYLPTQE